ncbi:MAG: ATP-binding cassette domain-containing protein, partial [Rhodococcus sp.]|nr:ATP-binding cassette domain-containing protein [Rhodococcus sp. (in: high G+C Gram-positive bacteria)]
TQVEDVVRELGAWDLLGHLLDTEVTEGGLTLSAGQRQLIAIARVWVRDPAILVLDEATNRLDDDADRLVRRALQRMRADRTTIMIAHRLSSALDADTVVVVDDGRIIETGDPTTLLATGGAFADLHRQWGRSETPARS